MKKTKLFFTALTVLLLTVSCNGMTAKIAQAENAPHESQPVVYFTKNITPEGVMAVYHAMDWEPTGKVAVKLSTGEPGGNNFLRADLIKDVVNTVNGTIVECNTVYGEERSNAPRHYEVAKEHGFTAIAPFQILDENGTVALKVTGGKNLKENYVGAHFPDYDSYLVLSHFKGHGMAGFGGAIKNISIGLAAPKGKFWIHSAGATLERWAPAKQDSFLESMAEAAKSVVDALQGKIAYVSVMNRLSVDCDCSSHPAEPDMHDIGVLASTDPVALDQACVDLVYKAPDGKSLIERMESKHGIHTLEWAEEIGLGSRKYSLLSVDQ